MKTKKKVELDSLTIDMVEREKERIIYRRRYLQTIRSTINILIVVAAIAVLIATMILPVLRVSGTSMASTFEDGQIIVAYKTKEFRSGELISFYYNNKVLIKRVIATAGQWVDIDENGVVSVNKFILDEPYVEQLSKGSGDIKFPYQVPDGTIFVLGDGREESIDSRYSEVGCIPSEDIIGKIFFRIYPFDSFGTVGHS